MKGLDEAKANLRRYSMPSAGSYDLVARFLFGGRYDEIARAIANEAPAHATVVDLGCGPGEVLARLATLAPSLELIGVDVDAGMIARATKKAARRGLSARFIVADAAALPLPDESVDLVVSSYAVHHLPDPHAARAEILRVLTPGGRALIWDIVSPHREPSAPSGESARAHDLSPAATHGQSPSGGRLGHALGMIRMMYRFGRTPAERFELRKPQR